MRTIPKLLLPLFAVALATSALAYNSLAPHTNAETTDFWDTTGYDVTHASSASCVCSTAISRLVRTGAESNEVQPFRRLHVIGFVIELR